MRIAPTEMRQVVLRAARTRWRGRRPAPSRSRSGPLVVRLELDRHERRPSDRRSSTDAVYAHTTSAVPARSRGTRPCSGGAAPPPGSRKVLRADVDASDRGSPRRTRAPEPGIRIQRPSTIRLRERGEHALGRRRRPSTSTREGRRAAVVTPHQCRSSEPPSVTGMTDEAATPAIAVTVPPEAGGRRVRRLRRHLAHAEHVRARLPVAHLPRARRQQLDGTGEVIGRDAGPRRRTGPHPRRAGCSRSSRRCSSRPTSGSLETGRSEAAGVLAPPASETEPGREGCIEPGHPLWGCASGYEDRQGWSVMPLDGEPPEHPLDLWTPCLIPSPPLLIAPPPLGWGCSADGRCPHRRTDLAWRPRR